jgi:hypothetical protein
MSNYYNKTEVDNKITDLYQIKIVSGSIVHFTDGGNDIPVKSLVSQIVAVQSGSGTPSPSNPLSISGYSSVNVAVSSKNMWANGDVSFTGNTTTVNLYQPLPPNTYTISATVTSNDIHATTCACILYYTDGTASNIFQFSRGSRTSITVVTPNKYIKQLAFYSSDTYIHGSSDTVTWADIQIEVGNQMTAYEAPTVHTVNLGQTIYGGYFDNKGNLVVTHGYIASYNGETINEPWVSSMDNYVPNTSPSTGAQVVYPLTTPITLAITSQAIPTLLGENNIFSNTGDVEVEYFTEKSDGIAELIKAFM